jgi:hypothetical protein
MILMPTHSREIGMVTPSSQAIQGGCYCGNVLLDLELTHELAYYSPRACDCGFCRKHSAAYLSDPQGSLRIRVDDLSYCGMYRQGTELAEMLLCTRCGVLVGALYRADGRTYATVNVRALEGSRQFGSEQPVSPKQLSAEEKVARWKSLWFSNVDIDAVE